MDSDDEIMFHQMMEEEANLDDDDEENQLVLVVLLSAQAELDITPKRGGLRTQRLANKNRFRTKCHVLLFNDYFSQTPTNNDQDFRRRFRMQRKVFIGIV